MTLTRRNMLAAAGSILIAFRFDAAIGAPKAARHRARSSFQKPSNRSMRTANSMVVNSKRRNGHLTRFHVGRSRKFLKTRASAPQMKSAFKKSVKHKTTKLKSNKLNSNRPLKRKEFSTFKDEKAVQLALARAIQRNRQVLRTMIKKGHTRKSITVPVAKNSGIVWLPGKNKFAQPNRAVFVVQRVGRRLIVRTGYLTTEGNKNV